MRLHVVVTLPLAGMTACAPLHQFAKTEVAQARCATPGVEGVKQDTTLVEGSRPAEFAGRRASAAETVVRESGLTHQAARQVASRKSTKTQRRCSAYGWSARWHADFVVGTVRFKTGMDMQMGDG